MNEDGARAQAAAAASVGRSFDVSDHKPPVKIDGDFLVWFETDGGVIPFAARITKADMKRPDSLR